MKEPTIQGLNLRRLRKERDLRQAELAYMAQTAPKMIMFIENGHRKLGNTLRTKFAEALGVAEGEFFKPISVTDIPETSHEGYTSPHSKGAANWQKRNPEKVKAAYLARYHSSCLTILYECCHDGPKENHHPFYEQPYTVIKLCPECHRLWHQRLRDEAKQGVQS